MLGPHLLETAQVLPTRYYSHPAIVFLNSFAAKSKFTNKINEAYIRDGSLYHLIAKFAIDKKLLRKIIADGYYQDAAVG